MSDETQEITPNPEVPDWVTTTPDLEPAYRLLAEKGDGDGCGGEVVQEINLSRAEYEVLKWRLAQSRGFEVQRPTETAPAEAKQEAVDRSVGRTYTLTAFDDGDSTENHELDQRTFEFLRTCLAIYENDEGSITPYESLFTQLAVYYGLGSRGPEQVRQLADEFQDNWETAVQHIGTVMRHCPELVKEATAVSGADADKEPALATA